MKTELSHFLHEHFHIFYLKKCYLVLVFMLRSSLSSIALDVIENFVVIVIML